MKILSDFDGVLTHPVEEIARVRALLRTRLSELPSCPKDLLEILENIEASILSEPSHHGWVHQGRLSAYCNEDGFIKSIALGNKLDALSLEEPLWRNLRGELEKVAAPSFSELSHECFLQMVKETREGLRNPLDPKVKPLFETLWSKGHEVVIVSNSGTERIEAILEQNNISPAPDRLRVRGHSKKFELGEKKEGFEFGNYFLESSRPIYRQILEEEKPDFLIGDVLSLDLALPLALVREGRLSTTLILRRRDYTPEWSQEFFTAQNKESHCVIINDLSEFTHPQMGLA